MGEEKNYILFLKQFGRSDNIKEIKKEELKNISGGFSTWMALGIAATVIFISGVINGIVHPNSCS